MEPYFEICTEDNGQFSFRFYNRGGELMLIGGEHEDATTAENTIKDVRVGTLMSTQIAVGKTPAGEMFFVIKDSSGQIVAKSVLFQNQMVFNNALHAVKDSACVAEIRHAAAA